MPVAVFLDAVTGLRKGLVKTDGPNAEADLAVHVNAAKAGLSVIRIEDADYEKFLPGDLAAHLKSITGKDPVEKPVQSALDKQRYDADKAAFDAAIVAKKSFAEADAAGKAAAMAIKISPVVDKP